MKDTANVAVMPVALTEIVDVADPAATPPDLLGMPVQQLLDELAKQAKKTADDFLRLAWIVRLLEEQGHDLSAMRNTLLPHLRRIAYGQLLPELLVRFGGNIYLLRRVSLLPLPDQRRLVETQSVELLVPVQDPANPEAPITYTKRQADPGRLTYAQINQVFGPDRLRGEAEQALYLDDSRTRPEPAPVQPVTGKVRADGQRGGLVVGRTFVSHADILAALTRLAPGEKPFDSGIPDIADRVQLPIFLTPDEHRALKIRAAQNDTSMGELMRRAMHLAGLI